MSGPAISRMSRSSARPSAPTPRRMRTHCSSRRALGAPNPEIVREGGEVGDGQIAQLIDRGVLVETSQKGLGRRIDGAVGAEGGPGPRRCAGDELVGGRGKSPARGGVHALSSF